MKKLTYMLILLASAGMALAQTQSDSFVFTRTDGTEWVCPMTLAFPALSAFVGSNATPIANSQTNAAYHSWSIDPQANTLLMDGVVRGVINIYGTGHVVNVGTHFGFCVDKFWRGYLICEMADGDPNSYLLQVDVTTGNATLISVVDLGNSNPVTGMVGVGPDFDLVPIPMPNPEPERE